MSSASKAATPAAPLSPGYILRVHSTQINTLSFSRDGRYLASGDADGYVCIWNLATFRPLLFWKAHGDSVLTLCQWTSSLVSHGRDNLIHVFDLPTALPSISAGSVASTPSHAKPSSLKPRCSMETNALAYCKCALLECSEEEAFVATPSVLSDELIDICHLPSCTRVSRSIGRDAWPVNDKTGTVMAVEMYLDDAGIVLLAAYEDGRLAKFTSKRPARWSDVRMDEGEGWQLAWYERGHREPTMGLAVSPNHCFAWTAAADHFVSRYDLSDDLPEGVQRVEQYATTHPGRASIQVRDDGRILAIGGWDGAIRVHSAKTFKPLAVLSFHRDSVYVVAFAPTRPTAPIGYATSESEDDDPAPRRKKTRAWLAAAGKDQRISLWELYPPAP